MERLITIRLHHNDKTIQETIQEHLAEDLKDGWKVKSMICTAAGCGAGGETNANGNAYAWLAVVLEWVGVGYGRRG